MSHETQGYTPIPLAEKFARKASAIDTIGPIPQDKIEAILARGDRPLSPFWVMRQFGIGFSSNKTEKDEVIRKISGSSLGGNLNFLDTPKGLRIQANQSADLVRAAIFEYPALLMHLPKNFRAEIDKHYKPLQRVA